MPRRRSGLMSDRLKWELAKEAAGAWAPAAASV